MIYYSLEGVLIKSALLVLEDGTQFIGRAIGATGSAVGEVVFNTSMTGYQEILTDPSYCQQLVTLTYPHIGNYGITAEDNESRGAFVSGFIAHEFAEIFPQFVYGEKDAVDENGDPVYQEMSTGNLVPYLVAAIKELSARLDALEA